MNPQKTILNGEEYELIPAEIVSIDLYGISKAGLYSATCKIIGGASSNSPNDVITAQSIDVNIKNIPIIGEIVFLMKGPTSFDNAARGGQQYYYTNPISIQNSVHHNGLPGVTEYLENKTPSNTENRNNTLDGIPNKKSKRMELKSKIDATFPERLDVYPIQPYPGDVIIEGRWGQSIRFGSTIDEREIGKWPYPRYIPNWQPGYGATGNPILVISNGTNPKNKKYDEFILENIDTDDSSIWMTSGQKVSFNPASSFMPSITDKNVGLYSINDYSGNQIMIASDRIILNAKKQELIGFSKESIGFSSEKTFSVDSKKLIEMESEKINLGLNANEPVLMGNLTADWLQDFCSLMINTLKQLSSLTVPTGVGPSGIPINSPQFNAIRAEVMGLSNRINSLKSELVFLNKNKSTK